MVRDDGRDSGEIVVRNVTKRYAARNVVDDLSFTVRPGRVTGFLGPNGAGKTTTLRVLLGLVRATSGTATIGGRQFVNLADPIRHVGALLEASSAHRGRSGHDHLRVNCAAAGLPMRRADEVLAMVGLSSAVKRKVRTYSLGMKQRLGLATALLGDPRVLILDEPVNGLDPEGIRWMRTLLRSLADEGRTVLVSSHLLSEMQQLADDVVIVAAGRLILNGSIDEVLASAGSDSRIRVRTPQAAGLRAALALYRGRVIEEPGGILLVSDIDVATISRTASAAGIEIHELGAEKVDLEEIFLNLTAGKAGVR